MKKGEIVLGILRISLGLIFLWAFIDKMFGLGFATTADKSWLAGVSPTSGFLGFGTSGPFVGIFQVMAGNIIVDILFMGGLLLIGLCLIFGVARKISGYAGALLMFLMWIATLPVEYHPFLDEHIIYLLILIFFSFKKTGLGFSEKWGSLKVVQKYKFLE